MGGAKIEIKVGEVSFAAEGNEKWLWLVETGNSSTRHKSPVVSPFAYGFRDVDCGQENPSCGGGNAEYQSQLGFIMSRRFGCSAVGAIPVWQPENSGWEE